MRVAALYDVHGNLPALEAVLAELDADVVVFGGDVAAGPFPSETLRRCRSVPNARFVSGNADRYLVESFDGVREPASITDDWVLRQLSPEQIEFLRGMEPTVSFDGVLYCHATPHDDEPGVTSLTPDHRLQRLFADVAERRVVIGHTHMQFDRYVGGLRVVNAGSVGFPKDGTGSAAWALVDGDEIELRRTPFRLDPLRTVAWDKIDLFLREWDQQAEMARVESFAS